MRSLYSHFLTRFLAACLKPACKLRRANPQACLHDIRKRQAFLNLTYGRKLSMTHSCCEAPRVRNSSDAEFLSTSKTKGFLSYTAGFLATVCKDAGGRIRTFEGTKPQDFSSPIPDDFKLSNLSLAIYLSFNQQIPARLAAPAPPQMAF